MAEYREVMTQGKRMCDSYKECSEECPFFEKIEDMCEIWERDGVVEAEEIIMKWASEHPIQTNVDKFEEVFGFLPNKGTCILLTSCEECFLSEECNGNGMISVSWWDEEYKSPTEEVSE